MASNFRESSFEGDARLAGDPISVSDMCSLLQTAEQSDSLSDSDYDQIFGDEEANRLSVVAIEILARFDAIEAIPAILSYLQTIDFDQSDDSWMIDGIADSLQYFGPESAASLMEFVADLSNQHAAKLPVIEGIRLLGNRDKSVHRLLSSVIMQGLENASKQSVDVNTGLIMLAIDWQLTEAAEPIERAFSINKVDCGTTGPWEETRQQLHVGSLGLPMPEKPHNTMDDFRRNLGIGCFSNDPISLHGHVQEDAAFNYYETACRTFANSMEGKGVLEAQQHPSFVHQFLELAISYLGKTVDTMTIADVHELLLELFPRKVNIDDSERGSVIEQLTAFWRFVDRVHDVELASKIADTIESMTGEFRDVMNDPSTFGMAKSFVTAGQEAGFDMTNQEGLNAFMLAYNQNLTRTDSADVKPAPSSVTGMSRKQRKKLLISKRIKKGR